MGIGVPFAALAQLGEWHWRDAGCALADDIAWWPCQLLTQLPCWGVLCSESLCTAWGELGVNSIWRG